MKKRFLIFNLSFLITLALIGFTSCQKPATSTFTYSPSSPKVGQAVQFTYTGSGGNTFLWSFGDGSNGSGSQNPVWTYTTAGTYSVTLTATNSAGSSTTSNAITIAP